MKHRPVPSRRARAIQLVIIFAGAAWFLAPFWLISSNVEKFEHHSDAAIGAVAHAAYEAAWMHNDNPIGRLMRPAASVRRVWRDPGHCARHYSYFGVPAGLLHVTCSGWAW